MRAVFLIALFPFALYCIAGRAPLMGLGSRNDAERTIYVYSHRHYEQDEVIYDLFFEETGVRVSVLQGNTSSLIARLLSEGPSTPADLLILSDVGQLTQATRMGLLQNSGSDLLDMIVPIHLRDPLRRWYAITKRTRVIVYSPDRVDIGELSSYEALADPQWKNRIVARSSTHPYNISLLSSIIVSRGMEAARAWVEGVTSNFARTPQGNDRDQIRAVASGIGDVAIVNSYYVGLLRNSRLPADQEVGNSVEVFFPNQRDRGAHINVTGGGVVSGADMPEEALLLLEFLLRKDTQLRFASANYEYPINSQVSETSFLRSLGAFVEDQTDLSTISGRAIDATLLFNQAGWR